MFREMELNSGTIFKYEELKGDSNQAILCVHGLQQTSFSFRELNKKLFSYCYKQATFVAVNLTGFGKSVNQVMNTTDYIDYDAITIMDLDEFFDRYNNMYSGLTWKVISFSIGTFITTSWLLGSPKSNVTSLILSSPFGFFSNVGSYGYYFYYIFKYKLLPRIYKFINYFFKYHKFIIQPWNYSFDMVANMIEKNENGTFFAKSLLVALKDIKIPIYLIYGANDYLVPYEQGNILQLLYPQIIKQCFVLKYSKHTILYDEEYYQIIKKILFQNKYEEPSIQQIIYSHPNIWQTETEIKKYYLLY